MTRDPDRTARRRIARWLLLAVALAGCGPLAPARPGAAPDAPAAAATRGAGAPLDGDAAPAATVPAGYPGRAVAETGDAGRGAYPPPDSAATAAALPDAVAAALGACDPAALDDHLTYRVTLQHAPGGGSDVLSGDSAAEAIVALACAADSAQPAPAPPPSTLAPVTDTLRGLVDPTATIAGESFSRGWGPDGRGEARLVALRDAEGDVGVGAVAYAAAGFGAEATAPLTRTVEFTSMLGLVTVVDIPAAWHTDVTAQSARLTSVGPFDPSLNEWAKPAPYVPGRTTVEIVPPDTGDIVPLDTRIRDTRNYEEAPSDVDDTRFTLASGESAALVTFTFEQTAWIGLYVDTGRGTLIAPCFGDPAPCAAILRSVRLR